MNKVKVLLVANLTAVLALFGYTFFLSFQPKSAFVLNQKVFEGFTGSKILTERLNGLKEKHEKNLDSLRALMQDGGSNTYGVQYLQRVQQEFELQEQTLAGQYTSDIWKKINQCMAKYGREHEYEYIFGAVGNGNLMYASDAKDITAEVIAYVNQQYEID